MPVSHVGKQAPVAACAKLHYGSRMNMALQAEQLLRSSSSADAFGMAPLAHAN